MMMIDAISGTAETFNNPISEFVIYSIPMVFLLVGIRYANAYIII